jgi:flagellar biosynthesis anti-sigma factor FlgM
MKISEIFSKQSLYNTERASEAARSGGNDANGAKRSSAEGDDSVSISPLARQFQQISTIVAEDESASQQRVQAIKARVESGKYAVTSDDVAKAMVSFFSRE